MSFDAQSWNLHVCQPLWMCGNDIATNSGSNSIYHISVRSFSIRVSRLAFTRLHAVHCITFSFGRIIQLSVLRLISNSLPYFCLTRRRKWCGRGSAHHMWLVLIRYRINWFMFRHQRQRRIFAPKTHSPSESIQAPCRESHTENYRR